MVRATGSIQLVVAAAAGDDIVEGVADKASIPGTDIGQTLDIILDDD